MWKIFPIPPPMGTFQRFSEVAVQFAVMIGALTMPAAGQVVIHEGLQEQLAHVLAAGGAGNRP